MIQHHHNTRRVGRTSRMVKLACIYAKAGKKSLIWTGTKQGKADIEEGINDIDPTLLSSGLVVVEHAGEIKGEEIATVHHGFFDEAAGLIDENWLKIQQDRVGRFPVRKDSA